MREFDPDAITDSCCCSGGKVFPWVASWRDVAPDLSSLAAYGLRDVFERALLAPYVTPSFSASACSLDGCLIAQLELGKISAALCLDLATLASSTRINYIGWHNLLTLCLSCLLGLLANRGYVGCSILQLFTFSRVRNWARQFLVLAPFWLGCGGLRCKI